MSLPCDFEVVQELGNIWPGWGGLGIGVGTPDRSLSPLWGKTSIKRSARYLRRKKLIVLLALHTIFVLSTHCREGTVL